MIRPSIAATSLACVLLVTASARAQNAPGEQLYRQRCMACHVTGASGQPGPLGPNLRGVIGRKAGASAYRNYSPALKGSGVTWSEAQLDRFLLAPAHLIPGTRMMIAVTDPAQRAALIAYLNGLR